MSIRGAKGVLINITGNADLSLHEVNDASTLIQEEAHEDANIIFGAVIDESMGDEMRVTVIATGFGPAALAERVAASTSATRPAVAAAAGGGSRPVFQAAQGAPAQVAGAPGVGAAQSLAAQSIRRVGASDRPVRRLGTLIDDGGEPKFKAADDPSVPDHPQTEFTIAEEDDATDYESPAFLRYQAK